MPVSWTISPQAPGTLPGAFALAAAPDAGHAEYRATLSPNVSMGPTGFARAIAITAFFFLLPLLGVLGTPVLWGLLPFLGLALWGLWYALSRNNAERRRLREELVLTREHIGLRRINPRLPEQHWDANPYWVTLDLSKTGGPIENYLTLSGSGRKVELGAFLSPEERVSLHDELSRALRALR